MLNEIKHKLSVLKSDLIQRYSISSIGLFGSIVRNDFNADSDIDIIVDFRTAVGMEFIALADELENKLHHKVDLVSRKGIKQKYFEAIEAEIIYV